MRIDANSLKGKGPLIISILAVSLLILTIVSVVMQELESRGELTDEIEEVEETIEVTEPVYYFGMSEDSVRAESDVIIDGQTFSNALRSRGLSEGDIVNLVEKSRPIFNVRGIRKGYPYTALLDKNSGKMLHFIYEINSIDYVKYSFGDTLKVERISRDVESHRKTLFVKVYSSLWESILAAGGTAPLVLAVDDIFQWTVDFYGVMQGDSFSIIYDENYVDGKYIGIGDVVAAAFCARGKSKYAFLYDNDGIKTYYDEEGSSMKRAFLKAPLRYSRISSKFTYRRLHPIHRVYKAHTGVDYAAPTGTPVQTIGDGVVTDKFYNAGGGNTLKVKHSVQGGAYVSGYLHLSKFASGISKGSRVSQGQVIGYVGSTGSSTGPHLDFRIWKNGKPIDPLRIDAKGGEPLKESQKAKYLESIASQLETLTTIAERGEKEISEAKQKELEAKRKLQEAAEQSVEPEHEI